MRLQQQSGFAELAASFASASTTRIQFPFFSFLFSLSRPSERLPSFLHYVDEDNSKGTAAHARGRLGERAAGGRRIHTEANGTTRHKKRWREFIFRIFPASFICRSDWFGGETRTQNARNFSFCLQGPSIQVQDHGSSGPYFWSTHHHLNVYYL